MENQNHVQSFALREAWRKLYLFPSGSSLDCKECIRMQVGTLDDFRGYVNTKLNGIRQDGINGFQCTKARKLNVWI